MQGDTITFIQDRNVGTNEIRSAPNVRVQQTMLAKCKEGQKEPVVCCVQSPYTVRWYDGSTLLTSGKYETNVLYIAQLISVAQSSL